MTIAIRKATEEDLQEVVALQQLFIKEQAQLHDPIFCELTPHAKEEWLIWAKRRLNDDNFLLLVASSDEKLVGYASGWIEKRSPIYALREVGYLSNMYIIPDFRGKGVGSQLNKHIIQWFKEKGMHFVELTTQTGSAAVDAWKAMGYKEVVKRMRLQL